jgi:hypothetical protein
MSLVLSSPMSISSISQISAKSPGISAIIHDPLQKLLPTSLISPFSVSPFSPMGPTVSPIGPIMSTVEPNMSLGQLPSNVLPTLVTTPYPAIIRPSIAMYPNLNSDKSVQKRIVKYFYYMLLDKWLKKESIHLLNYFTMKGAKVSLISKTGDYNKTKTVNEKDIKPIIKYIEEEIIKEKHMIVMLHKFVKETGINWYDLPHNEYYVRRIVESYSEKIIRSRF